jgi:hypothetical protein
VGRAGSLLVLAAFVTIAGCGDDDDATPSFDEDAVRDAVSEIYPGSPDPEQLVALARHDCEDTDEQFRFTVNLMVSVGSDLSLLAAGCPDRLRDVLEQLDSGS